MVPRRAACEAIIQTAVETLGLALFGLEFLSQGTGVMRVYIDKPGGVTIDDCADASRQIKALLRVQLPEAAEMGLEVSSPGMDRRLFTPAQATDRLGAQVHVRLKVPEAGQRQVKGQLTEVTAQQVTVTTEARAWVVAWDSIEWMRVIPQI